MKLSVPLRRDLTVFLSAAALGYLRRLKYVLFFAPAALIFASAPIAEVHRRCIENSREVYQARLMDCRNYGRHASRCRAEAEKEKRELLDYCAAGVKKQPSSIVVTSH